MKYVWPAPALLVVVAAGQFLLTEYGQLSRWKGGGFGMFSQVDHRIVDVRLLDADGEELAGRIFWPPALTDRLHRLEMYPTESGLAEFAAELASGRWQFYFKTSPEGAARPPLHVIRRAEATLLDTYMAFPAEVAWVELSAWRVEFRPRGEDANANGALDPNEDKNGNGVLDRPGLETEKFMTHRTTVP